MSNSSAKIKVIGVGGSGGNAVSRMVKCKIQGVDLIAANCDFQDLKKTNAFHKIQIGRDLTKGLGAGMNPSIGKKAAEESSDEIKQALLGADIVFVVCGLGGGTGSGASSVIAGIAKELGALTIGAVTLPFAFEGAQRKRIAAIGEKKLREKVDTLFVIPNDNLLSQIKEDTTCENAFWICDEVLRQAVQGISDLIVRPGIINVDFADVKSIMADSGSALFGVGMGKGENKIEDAAAATLNSPFLQFPIKGAKRILFNITGGKNLSLMEVEQAAKIITQDTSATKVIFGAIEDKKLKPDQVKITLIAAGIE
ncbi:cell division protein FtsZ [Patescibacteria group bacterium]|nr:cell division protein FtsZ [Patescibacteria group bacterium]MBU4022928.1 cell division protein FtsZ [Patescibacteria group bacterium]MBU4078298.1 cell division protein FtsZ [Patescibacteria group bacterium]